MKVLKSLIFIILAQTLQSQNISFNTISSKDGLSNNYVTSVIEDHNGFLWIGTSEGLNRWDGYTFKIFRNIPINKNTIAGNLINCLFEDAEGNLWIGTNQNGISKYNISSEEFTKYNFIPGDETSLPGPVIRFIFQDNKKNIWIGTNDGMVKYIPSTNKFKMYYFELDGVQHRSHLRRIYQINDTTLLIQNNLGKFTLNLINEDILPYPNFLPESHKNLFGLNYPVLIDSEKNFWMGSRTGIIKYNLISKTIKQYNHNINDENSISSDRISIFFEDKNKNIWIGTENNGLNLYNKDKENFTTYKANPFQRNSLSNNIITNIYESKDGTIWVSTQEGGVNYFNNEEKLFEQFANNPLDNNSLRSNKIGAFCEDEQGNIWIGTGNGYVSKFNSATNSFQNIKLNTEVISPSILGIKSNPAKSNSIFIVGWGVGLYELNTLTHKLSNVFNSEAINEFQPSTNIKGLGTDSQYNLWLASHDANGVIVYNTIKTQISNRWYPDEFDAQFLASPYPVSMHEDSKNRKWIVTYTGLFMYDSVYHSFRCNPNDSTTIGSNYVYTLYEDSKKNIWIGHTYGLDKLIEKQDTLFFERINQNYDLPINIKGILEDDNGVLWLSSNHGISTFDPETKKTKRILGENELNNQEFFERSCLKAKNGEMYFGGTDGFLRFHPDTILKKQHNPKLFVVDFQIFNKSQFVNSENSPLTKSILETEYIELTYKQTSLSFEYAALNFTPFKNFEYAYILEGFDQNWNQAGNKRTATYTNLPPGNYLFKVKLVNGGDPIDHEGVELKITIHPPFWKTNIAYLVYVLTIILLLYAFRRSIIYREKLRGELKMEKIALKNVHESNLMKLRFFTNISHEFRTPLTLIKAPIDKLLTDNETTHTEDDISQLKLIQKNADKLLKMVNQLMDYRKLEAGSLILETSKGDIVEFCKKTWEVFNLLATQQKIKYEFKSSIKKQIMSFDPDKLDKILSNLISNSIKNTNEYGHITVSINKLKALKSETSELDRDEIEISVKDDGVGIPKTNLPFIFDRFFSVSKKTEGKIVGTGIGLTLVKELTELHGGSISVISTEGEGTEFKVILPMNLQSVDVANEGELSDDELSKYEAVEQQIENKIENKPNSNKRFKILVVEDDPDLRTFIKTELSNYYEVITAKDGEDGLRKAFFNFPELIISDVMMPNMDGLEFCRSIKADERTSHTPVILLTARHSEEKHIEGFEAGADDYIFKPFNLNVLKSRISNLLARRTELMEKFSQGTSFDFNTEGIEVKDKELIQSIIDIVLENINEEKINAEFISNRIHISRSLLYIKVEAITGQSVNEFIRGIRLKKSLKLLAQNSMTITEIAYAVGFSSQPYYTRCFTKLYGVSPTEYYAQKK